MFKTLKKASTGPLKLVELHKPITGVYLRKDPSDFSVIYVLLSESNVEVKIYGTKSLDQEMDDSLIGKLIQISRKGIKYAANGTAYGIAEVAVWDESSDDSSETNNSEDGVNYGFVLMATPDPFDDGPEYDPDQDN